MEHSHGRQVPQEGPGQPTGGQLNSALANAVVRVHSRHVGRGPTKARAFYRDNVVVLLLEDAFTAAERSLIASGNGELTVAARTHLHDGMRSDLVFAVEALTGSNVIALMSSTSIEPDMVSQVFVLDRPVSAGLPNAL